MRVYQFECRKPFRQRCGDTPDSCPSLEYSQHDFKDDALRYALQKIVVVFGWPPLVVFGCFLFGLKGFNFWVDCE